MTDYPEYKKAEPRDIHVSDFPLKVARWTRATEHYFVNHHIDITSLSEVPTLYPTARGICFVMTGSRLCFQERITDSHSPLRFWSPPGSPLGQVLYRPCPFSDHSTVFVVEGLTDALAVSQSGHNVVSVIGAKVSEYQLGLLYALSVNRELVLVPDNDEPGEQCANLLQRELPLRVLHLPSRYKDICDLTSDQRLAFLNGGDGHGRC